MAGQGNPKAFFGVLDAPLVGAFVIVLVLGTMFLIFQGKSAEYECQNQALNNQNKTTQNSNTTSAPPALDNGEQMGGQQSQQANPCQADTGFGHFVLSNLRRIARVLRRYSELITAIFTGVLMAFTGFLWKSTNDLWKASNLQGADMKRQIEATEKMSDAAQRSAKAAEDSFRTLERPYVLADDIWGIEEKDGKYSIEVRCVNHGRSPAIVTWIRSKLFVADKVPAEMPCKFQGVHWGWDYSKPLAEREEVKDLSYPIPAEIKIEKKHIKETDRFVPVLAEGKCAYFLIEITYDDVFGVEHATQFLWEYLPDRGLFRRPDKGECRYIT